MNLPVICPGIGSLEKYIRTVNSFEVLTHEQELYLANKFKDEDDIQSAHELVTSHLRVVVSVARGYYGYGLPQEDLIQEGNIGLMNAVKKYDPERGVRLVSFALQYIRGTIQDYIVKNWRLVKIATTKSHLKLFWNLRSLKKDLASLTFDQITEIAEQLNVSEQDVIDMESRIYGREISIEVDTNDHDDQIFNPILYLADNSEHEPDNKLEQFQVENFKREKFALALSELDDRSRKIIDSRWLCEEGKELTFQSLATELGISLQRVKQLEVLALKKMKNIMEQEN
jgi:RNA polymerase sigma-32 factor